MALKVKHLSNGQMLDCELKITSILGEGQDAAAYAEITNERTSDLIAARLFTFNAQKENDFDAAYQHIKNLPEFEGAIDL